MIATAQQAIPRLRHARSGELMPEKRLGSETNCERQTKLVYMCDELVGLKFHDTIIAWYQENGVSIDVRANEADIGNPKVTDGAWFTPATWNAIEQFTPATVEKRNGIYYVNGELYGHGLHIAPDGTTTSPFHSLTRQAIEQVISTYPTKLCSHANKLVRRFLSYGDVDICGECEQNNLLDNDEQKRHYLTHVEASEMVVPEWMRRQFNALAGSNNVGRDLHAKLSGNTVAVMRRMYPLAVKNVEPEFPFPQTIPRRT